MVNKEYWKDRAITLEQKTNQISKDGYKEIVPAFEKARKEIQTKIDSWLTRIAENNQVSLEKAREMLDKKELAEFRMDVQEYIQYGQENALNQQWMKELENASAKHHIDKLTALKTQIEAEYQKAFKKENDVVTDTVKEAYKDRYYRTAYEIENGFKLENTIGTINEKKLDTIINKPWAADGSNFSDRIWVKKDQMVDTLYKQLVQELVSGESLKDAIDQMTKLVDMGNKNAKYCAARLIQTEAAYFASTSQHECYEELDVEEYEIVATLDNHTSNICQGMDGQHFKMSEYEVGVTAPPFHVFCRSTTCPYFNDEFSYGDRAARGKDKKTYLTHGDLTYKEWKSIVDKETDIEYLFKKEAKGKFEIPDIYKTDDKHSPERKAMDILYESLGGDIEMIPESNKKTSDYLWNGKYWEFKRVSSDNSLDKAIRKGAKQINDNVGGLILEMDNSKLKNGQIVLGIINRLKKCKLNTLDVIFLKNNKIQRIMRYKK